MKNTLLLTTLISGAVLGLSACGSSGGGGGGTTVSKFNGTWNGACEESTFSRSFKQSWKINGANLDNDISVWTTPSCTPGNPTGVGKAKATIEYQDEVTVSHTCKTGEKAQGVRLTYNSLDAGLLGQHNGETDINGFLNPQGVFLPKYNLVCIDANGKLRTGLITVDKDGSTKDKRPAEMDSTASLSP